MHEEEIDRQCALHGDLICAIENAVRAARAAGLSSIAIGHGLHVQLKLIDPEFERHHAEWRRQFVTAPSDPWQPPADLMRERARALGEERDA
jgi:hypothetical protein